LQSKLKNKKEENILELSENAKVVFAAEKAKRLGAIRAKVKTDFYFRPEVTEKVVECLLRELQNINV
jgi:6-pyruvoyl-tetrahydropterin synthase